jgi:hypothetical protein
MGLACAAPSLIKTAIMRRAPTIYCGAPFFAIDTVVAIAKCLRVVARDHRCQNRHIQTHSLDLIFA